MKFINVPVIVPCFNNLTYTRNMLNQLQILGFQQIVVIDNASSAPDMQMWLQSSINTDVTVVVLSENPGPHYAARDPFLASLPQHFCITDPDLIFNPNLPDGFIDDLILLTERYRVGKAGFALDISDRETMRDDLFLPGTNQKFYDWEAQFWINPLEPSASGDAVYMASIDTTFALYNKNYYNYATFLNAVRVAGRFTAQHLPWYRDSGFPAEEATFYAKTQKYSFYITEESLPKN